MMPIMQTDSCCTLCNRRRTGLSEMMHLSRISQKTPTIQKLGFDMYIVLFGRCTCTSRIVFVIGASPKKKVIHSNLRTNIIIQFV